MTRCAFGLSLNSQLGAGTGSFVGECVAVTFQIIVNRLQGREKGKEETKSREGQRRSQKTGNLQSLFFTNYIPSFLSFRAVHVCLYSLFEFRAFSSSTLLCFVLVCGKDFLPFHELRCREETARFDKAIRLLDKLAYQLIADRRALLAAIQKEGETHERRKPRDILTLLIETCDPETKEFLDDEQIRDEVVTSLIAGHETTGHSQVR